MAYYQLTFERLCHENGIPMTPSHSLDASRATAAAALRLQASPAAPLPLPCSPWRSTLCQGVVDAALRSVADASCGIAAPHSARVMHGLPLPTLARDKRQAAGAGPPLAVRLAVQQLQRQCLGALPVAVDPTVKAAVVAQCAQGAVAVVDACRDGELFVVVCCAAFFQGVGFGLLLLILF